MIEKSVEHGNRLLSCLMQVKRKVTLQVIMLDPDLNLTLIVFNQDKVFWAPSVQQSKKRELRVRDETEPRERKLTDQLEDLSQKD